MSLNNVFLFTGDNAFAIQEERRLWVTRFTDKYGIENLQRLEGEHLVFRALLDEISVAPFIADKRLVIVDGMPRWTGEETEQLFVHIHPQVVLLFISPKIDRRGGAVRVLFKYARCQMFPLLKGVCLHAWIEHVARSHGTTISREARERLTDLVGMDQGMLFQEIRKLALGRTEVTLRDIDALVVPSREWVRWHLNNVVAKGDPRLAIRCAERLLQEGEDAFGLWNMLLVMLRQLTVITAALEEGMSRAADIGEQHNIHPFVVTSLLPLARRLRLGHLRVLIDDVVEMDQAIKSGTLRATTDDSTELYALIDQCVLKISSAGRAPVSW